MKQGLISHVCLPKQQLANNFGDLLSEHVDGNFTGVLNASVVGGAVTRRLYESPETKVVVNGCDLSDPGYVTFTVVGSGSVGAEGVKQAIQDSNFKDVFNTSTSTGDDFCKVQYYR